MKNTVLILVFFSIVACSKKDKPEIELLVTVPEFYLDENKNEPMIVPELGFIEGISGPRDLDFKPGKNELWVMNKGSNGSDFVIVFNPGESNESVIKRKDSHSGHFVPNGSAMAFSNINTFGTTPELKNSVGDTSSTFMGPALWSGDLSIFANVNQSNWDPGTPLGSHLDMLHQSPYAMGIAHDVDNTFFVLDGWNNNLCQYDFGDDHGPGAEYHADGRIFRYIDVPFNRVKDVPSHIIKDQSSGYLYWCNTASGSVMKVDLSTAKASHKLQAKNELLARYYAMTGATMTTVADGLSKPSGIAINGNNLFVSDYESGIIYVYDLTTHEQLAELDTGDKGVTGLAVSPSNRIWFVNYLTNKAYQIIPQ